MTVQVGHQPEQEKHRQQPQEGGRQGWLCVLGSFCISFCTFGYLNAFGVYQAYYKAEMMPEVSESTISWIGSLQVFFMFAAGLISGPLADRYGPKVILYPCCTLYLLSIMMTSLCKSFYQFILAQGILGGISNGMTYTPAVAAAGQYFHRRRPLALSIVMSGSSLGGIVYSIMLNRLLHHTTAGFGWSVRAVGFVSLVLAVIACTTISAGAGKRRGSFLLLEPWKTKPYTVQVVGMFLIFWGLFIPFFFIPSYATTHRLPTDYSFYLIAIINGPSLFGRLMAGAVANHIGRFNTVILAGACCAILIFCWLRTESKASITVFTALFGFFSGAVIGLFTATIAMLAPAPNKIGTYVGMALGVYGVAALTGPPIAGAMIAHYGNYVACTIFAGVTTLAGTAVMILARYSLGGRHLVA